MQNKNSLNCGYQMLTVLLVLMFSITLVSIVGADENPSTPSGYMYAGSYSSANGDGIYIFKMDNETGALQLLKAVKAVNPSFLILHPNNKVLYAVNETQDFNGQPGGAVSAYAIDPQTGDLTLLNQQSTIGGSPCHLTFDKSGKYLLVANYGGGNVTVLPVNNDGSLGKATDLVQHTGSSINKQRQEAPHAHAVALNPKGNIIYAVDLGIDKVMIYNLDTQNGKLTSNDPPFFKTADGAGPRHLSFHPNGQYAYIINELNSTITCCTVDAKTGALTEIQSISTLPQNYSGYNSCAEVQVSADGRFVYASNRGHNSIAIFAIDEKTGPLSLCGHESTLGKTPRHFTIDPTGKFLLAANQGSNDIHVFRINNDGSLTYSEQQASIFTPVCLIFSH